MSNPKPTSMSYQPEDWDEGYRKALLGMLRDARAVVYRNSESFSEAAAVLEHVGQQLRGELGNGLSAYEKVICDLAETAPPIQRERVKSLFDTVRKARNDSVHSGDFIRHHATRLVELFLLLEEGLSMSGKNAGDLMVQNPTTAELWHNIAAVRRAMLTNAFSFLPLKDTNGVWKLLSDVSIVRYLKHTGTDKDRNKLLGKQVQKALEDGEIELTDCNRISEEESVDDIARAMNHVPVLIIKKDGNNEDVIGILTAFDLL
jgi:CBS domain-containing protein